jgi:hypothetical protein
MNKLGIASIVLIVLAGLVLWKSSARRAEETEKPKVTVVLPKLKADDIDELELSAKDKPKVKLVKKDGAWRLTEPVDATADDSAVKTALTKLTELEVTGVAATLKKNHEKLEVDPANATRVIAKGAGKTLLDAYIGAYRGGSSMVRLEGQDAVATVKGSIRFAFSKETREWRHRAITEIPVDKVQRLTFVNTSGKLVFERDGDNWKQVLAKGEKPIAPLDMSKVKGILGTAANLDATDFAAPGETPDQLGLGEGAATMTLDLKADADAGAAPSPIVYRIGKQKEQSYYLQKEGDPIIYVVSQWIGGRLLANRETFIKKEAKEGSPDNPIKVMPSAVKNLPPGMQMMPMPQGGPHGGPPPGH